ncbi:MAG: peptidase M22 [Clostridiales bacterium]|nr:peptidase M22 [Clostridiales bacterium]
MGVYLGFDTSNYTTSVAIYDSDSNKIEHKKRLLPVKKGERGIRQSDAVFYHNIALPILANDLFSTTTFNQKIKAVGVSNSPRNVENSYMPCFLAGVSVAQTLASVNGIECMNFSHQQGHIIAALYSANKLELINQKFIAFHLSGGTTEILLVTPSDKNVIDTQIIAQSSDLKAGQAVDRVGVMLGLDFPAGMELDRLACLSEKQYKIKPSVKGLDCSFSGVENKCKKMINDGCKSEDIARYCIEYIYCTLDLITTKLIGEYKDMPLVFSGGVMSNSIIRNRFVEKYNAYFAAPEFSSDNAAGIAILASIKDNLL